MATFSWRNSAGMAITSGGPYTITAGESKVNESYFARTGLVHYHCYSLIHNYANFISYLSSEHLALRFYSFNTTFVAS